MSSNLLSFYQRRSKDLRVSYFNARSKVKPLFMVIKGSLWRNCKFWAQNIQNRSEYASMGPYWKFIRQNSLHAWNLDMENNFATCSNSLGHSRAISYIQSNIRVKLYLLFKNFHPFSNISCRGGAKDLTGRVHRIF